MRRLLLVPLLVALGAVLVPAVAAAPASATTGPLSGVLVSGKVGEKPTVKLAGPVNAKASTSMVLAKGTGDAAKKGSTLTIDYVILNGRDGTELESSYGTQPATVVLNAKQSLPALVKGLTGAQVGDRRIVAIAPKDGVTKNAPAESGVQKNDTLLFVIDVKNESTPLARAQGTAVPPVAGLPTVTLAKDGAPTIKIPAGDPPTTLVAQPLIKGDGPVVQKGQTITVNYTGVNWRTGKVFDSSWGKSPAAFPIGVSEVVAGWDEGLVGQTVGSQVLLVIPPDKGYGSSGQPSAGINGTDTLVFVVDILAAA